MKKIFLLVVVLIIAQKILAQDTSTLNLNNYKVIVNSILHSQITKQSVAKRPNGKYYRLIAQSETNTFANTVDSQIFKYSGHRTSRFDYEDMNFLYNKNFDNFYEPIPSSQDYPAAMADSIFFHKNDYVMPRINVAEYNTNDKIRVNSSIDAGGAYYRQQINDYNSGGCIATTYYVIGNFGQHDTLYQRNFTYSDDFSRIMTDSFFYKIGNNLVPYGAIEYYYNKNMLDSSFGVTITRDGEIYYDSKAYFKYDEKGRLQTSNFNILLNLGTSVREIHSDSFSYSPGVFYSTFREYHRQYINPTYTSSSYTREIRYPGTNGFPDSVVSFYKNDYNHEWTHSQTAVFNYTNFLAPDYITFYSYYGNSSIKHKFYYEEQEKANRANNLEVYPNPFNDRINIKYHGYIPSKYSISIMDISGRKVHIQEIQLLSGNNYINLSALASGIYVLYIQDSIDKEILWISKMVKKI